MGVCLAAFFVLRLFVPSEYAVLVLGIQGAIFVSYMANLGVNMVRNPPPPPGKSDGVSEADSQ